jgi:predicted nucleic acid-binding Zn ribbon protein
MGDLVHNGVTNPHSQEVYWALTWVVESLPYFPHCAFSCTKTINHSNVTCLDFCSRMNENNRNRIECKSLNTIFLSISKAMAQMIVTWWWQWCYLIWMRGGCEKYRETGGERVKGERENVPVVCLSLYGHSGACQDSGSPWGLRSGGRQRELSSPGPGMCLVYH